jgi:hypothetical protein
MQVGITLIGVEVTVIGAVTIHIRTMIITMVGITLMVIGTQTTTIITITTVNTIRAHLQPLQHQCPAETAMQQ